jgi:hypothetical protein
MFKHFELLDLQLILKCLSYVQLRLLFIIIYNLHSMQLCYNLMHQLHKFFRLHSM